MSVRKGTLFEYQARDNIVAFLLSKLRATTHEVYQLDDFYYTRSARSHSEADLVFVFRNPNNVEKTEVWLVQCSLSRKSKSEIDRLVKKCKNCGATPVLAYKKGKSFILDFLDYDGNVANSYEL
ncbi:MAG: hypothetical protein ACPLYF_02545 [Fervidobacterium sp.]